MLTTYTASRLEGVPDPRPSTSREEVQQSPHKSPAKRNCAKKQFTKFKDDKYKFRAKKNVIKTNEKHLRCRISPSQLISRKILRTIKKKMSPNSTIKKNSSISRREHTICDLTTKGRAKTGRKLKSRNGKDDVADDDDDDDCVLIDTSPEIILIDDETTANSDTSNSENISNISNLILKSYQPIGSYRDRDNFQKMLHSTPKLIHANESTRYPKVPYYKRPMPMILEGTSNDHNDSSLNAQTNEPVVIDDTADETIRNRKRKSTEDDSVIFVSEVVEKNPEIEGDFIPLTTETEKFPISTTSQEPRQKRQRNELFTSKEQRQLQQYNENAYNPNKDNPTTVTQKRMVIVDGSNVAYQHALNKEFSVKGLKICLEYFEKLGHEVKAVVPQFRLQKLKSTDPTALEKLHEEGKIVFTPCKNLPGKSSSSYDDRFILQLAAELDAAIVSNDNYRDLIHENPAFKKIIENRVVGFSWCNDLFILPKDPYGKWGPTLGTILNRS